MNSVSAMDTKSWAEVSSPPENVFDDPANALHLPLNAITAATESARCYYCYDAPCTQACPTGIDVPGFIKMIAHQNYRGAANLILQENIMGGTCARVCPTEVLCQEACVYHHQQQPPVTIGQLQAFAVDGLMARNDQLFYRLPRTGKRIAVVGVGPAGLSCAHRLARYGHDVIVFEAREKTGGLNTYGLAAYKVTNSNTEREIEYILDIGGIDIRHGQKLGRDMALGDLVAEFDGVFVGAGLAGSNRLQMENEDADGVMDALDYIADLRQAEDLNELKVGRSVMVIGGGMTAIDIAVQAKLLGAQEVTILYRRGQEQMNASTEEQHFAQTKGVHIVTHAQPHELIVSEGQLTAVVYERTVIGADGALQGTGEFITQPVDQLFRAIGQKLQSGDLYGVEIPETKNGRLLVDEEYRTTVAKVWAGGDCINNGKDLTVAAVQDGKLAAESIHRYLESGV